MGTRSLTFVHEEDGPAIICIYQQFDGYFDGVGDEILRFLKGSEIVNGIGPDGGAPLFNGAGDLACRLITHFKGGNADSAGGVYIEPADSEDGDMGTEFAYHIYCTVGEEPRLRALDVYAGAGANGPVSEIVWPTKDDDGEYVVSRPTVDTSGPLTDDLRRALFAMFVRVFNNSERAPRQVFTRAVLAKVKETSWSPSSAAAITVEEAGQLLRALEAIEQTQLA